ncbi:hypothetical protein BGAL_0117g00130 [Botrytis galanthina]|uniref:Uncharacterized protein n=1 Tax=Botrytis galanthina TaxID=278940 RepID=A0A4S8R0L7_9HELO|nr:hypothetical protein BGAL_0117g00130 [Botrytis galanthina]
MGGDKNRDKKRERKPLPTLYESEDERRSVRKSDTKTSSHYPSSHVSSRRTTDTSEGYTERRSKSQMGQPIHDFEDPNTAKSVVSSIASISSRGHKSATVVGEEAARKDRKDRRSKRDDWYENEKAVKRAREKMEQIHGSLSEKEKDDKTSDYTKETMKHVSEDRLEAAAADLTRSQAASVNSHASRATRDTRDTRDYKHKQRSGSEAPSSRQSQSTVTRDESPRRRGKSSRNYTSTTMIAISGDANVAIHDYKQGVSTYISSRSGERQHRAPRPSSFSSHSSDTQKYRHVPALHPQLVSRPRIEELESETASSYGSESTARPLRIGNGSTRSSSLQDRDLDLRTVTSSQASRFLKGPAPSYSGYLQPTGPPLALEPAYRTEVRKHSWAESSVAGSSSRPAPSLSNNSLSTRSKGGSQYGGSQYSGSQYGGSQYGSQYSGSQYGSQYSGSQYSGSQYSGSQYNGSRR